MAVSSSSLAKFLSRLGLVTREDTPPSSHLHTYSLYLDFHAYGDIPAAYAADVLDDFYELSKLGFMYQPWVHFSEPLFHGKRVNVDSDERGFPIRRTINPGGMEALPIVRIFAMGGSTTFGYNVSDEHTWPSYLSEILNERLQKEGANFRIEVVNYGRGFYYPSQETALIIDLFKSGHRPSLVIFMDGVNPGSAQDLPPFYRMFERRFRNAQFDEDLSIEQRPSVVQTLKWIPVVRLANGVRHRLIGADKAVDKKQDEDDSLAVDHAVNLFRQNQDLSDAICRLYSAQTLFFLQPNATYNYPEQLYRAPLSASFLQYRKWAQQFYARMERESRRTNLSHLFEAWGNKRKAIVDDVHYSPPFNKFLAEHVARYIRLGTLSPRNIIDVAAATGPSRTLPPAN